VTIKSVGDTTYHRFDSVVELCPWCTGVLVGELSRPHPFAPPTTPTVERSRSVERGRIARAVFGALCALRDRPNAHILMLTENWRCPGCGWTHETGVRVVADGTTRKCNACGDWGASDERV